MHISVDDLSTIDSDVLYSTPGWNPVSEILSSAA